MVDVETSVENVEVNLNDHIGFFDMFDRVRIDSVSKMKWYYLTQIHLIKYCILASSGFAW